MNHKYNDPDYSGRTPLHQAVRYGRLKVVKSLIAAGAHINATDDELFTPLHVIGEFNPKWEDDNFNSTADDFYAIAVLLIENGSDLNAKDAYGFTPLYWIKNERSKFLI